MTDCKYVGEGIVAGYKITIIFVNLMFVDPCIIVQFTQKNPTICNNVSKIYYFIFIWSSTCFGRHTAHHQEPKIALAAFGLHTWKVVGRVVAGRCQSESEILPDSVQHPHFQQPSTYVNQRLLVQF